MNDTIQPLTPDAKHIERLAANDEIIFYAGTIAEIQEQLNALRDRSDGHPDHMVCVSFEVEHICMNGEAIQINLIMES